MLSNAVKQILIFKGLFLFLFISKVYDDYTCYTCQDREIA